MAKRSTFADLDKLANNSLQRLEAIINNLNIRIF
jgi:hypothetical protein